MSRELRRETARRRDDPGPGPGEVLLSNLYSEVNFWAAGCLLDGHQIKNVQITASPQTCVHGDNIVEQVIIYVSVYLVLP